MKKKIALLLAAIMTVAMVPMSAIASTKLTVVDDISVTADEEFDARVEIKSNDDQTDVAGTSFVITLKLTNGKFTKDSNDDYEMESAGNVLACEGVNAINVLNDTTAEITINTTYYNSTGTTKAVVINIVAKAVDTGDVTATFTSNISEFKKVADVIAVAYGDRMLIENDGVVTFVEDNDDAKELKLITIEELTINTLNRNSATALGTIKLKLSGNFEFTGGAPTISFLNDAAATTSINIITFTDDTLEFTYSKAALTSNQLAKISITDLDIEPTNKAKAGNKATIAVSCKEFDTVKLEVAKMVEESVTYAVADKTLPVIWAGKANDELNTLEVSIEENTGDILNTSRKATFTFPKGIEIAAVDITGGSQTAYKISSGKVGTNFDIDIDENVVTIKNYSKTAVESNKVDFGIKFIINAAPSFEGDVKVTLGGQFEDKEFTVATVKAPYTVKAETTEVLIDYRYVPVNKITVTEAEEALLEAGDEIRLQVEKMEFEDAGEYEVTEGDLEIDDVVIGRDGTLNIIIDDESTEPSTLEITGLQLYLDRTLPVGGYALEIVDTTNSASNILWENSSTSKSGYDLDGIFKYDEVTVNDSYVEVITSPRDQDDATTTRKIIITIGAQTMTVGTSTLTLDTPAYINNYNYTQLPLRAVSEAFGATVAWDDASKTVSILMGQRVISMTIGSKTMFINGTPVAMNTAPEITNSRTFIPVRDLANALGITKIDWNEATATVTLN